MTRDTRHVTRDHAGERDAARDTAGHAGHRHHRYVTVTVRTVCTCKCCDMRTFCKLHRITETLLPHAAPVQCNYIIIYPQLARCPPRAGRWCSPSPRAASTCPGPRPPWQTRTPSPGKQSSHNTDTNGISRQNCQPVLDPAPKCLYVFYNVSDNRNKN